MIVTRTSDVCTSTRRRHRPDGRAFGRTHANVPYRRHRSVTGDTDAIDPTAPPCLHIISNSQLPPPLPVFRCNHEPFGGRGNR
jgi:hypothetical protein